MGAPQWDAQFAPKIPRCCGFLKIRDAIDNALPSLSAQSTAADKAITDAASEIQHLKAAIKRHTSQPTSRSFRSPSPPLPYFCSISPPLTPPDQQAPQRKEGCWEGADSRLRAETDAESSPSAGQQWQHRDGYPAHRGCGADADACINTAAGQEQATAAGLVVAVCARDRGQAGEKRARISGRR